MERYVHITCLRRYLILFKSKKSLRKTIAYQAINAVHQVHAGNYVHLDIQPSNFLIDVMTEQLMLTNFESSQPMEGISYATDVNSLGVMLFNVR